MKFLTKSLSLMASALVVLLLSGFIGLEPVEYMSAYAQATPVVCQDITMAAGHTYTDAVSSPSATGREAGIADSGQLNFDLPADETYRACTAETTADWEPGQPVPATVFNGWAWNTNLGYVSFACDGTAGNLGSNPPGKSLANCGNFTYGVKTVNGNLLRGFAWGDNIGYISMGCDAGQNNDGTNSVGCGNTNYGVKIATAATLAEAQTACPGAQSGDLYGYAWADSVGWMNFCGAHAEGGAGGYTVNTKFNGVNDTGADLTGGIGADTPVATVYANGAQYHELRVRIFNNYQQVTSDPGFTVTATWNDKVKIDQITPCNVVDAACTAAVTKGNFAWDSTGNLYAAKVTSVAPTGGDNKLLLEKITVTQNSTGKNWVVEYPAPGKEFTFLPAIGVSKILAADEAGILTEAGTLSTLANTPQKVQFQVKKDAKMDGVTPDLTAQIYNCAGGAYGFVLNGTGDGPEKDAQGNPESALPKNPALAQFQMKSVAGSCTNNPQLLADVFVKSGLAITPPQPTNVDAFVYTYSVNQAQSIETTKAVGLQTMLSYTANGKNVKYLSKKLADGTVINQAADVRGNVSLNVFDKNALPSTGVSASIGGKNKDIREGFVRALRMVINPKVINKLQGSSKNNVKIDSGELEKPNGNTGETGLFYYSKKNLQADAGGKPCAVVLDNNDDISFSGSKTVVVEGCNIFIDQNIITSTGRLGIIALEDLTTHTGGNVYICSKVTDIEANLAADGSVFSYGYDTNDCGSNKNDFINADGTPDYGKKNANVSMRELLKNQLTIKGSLQTNNTYGGSVLNEPLMCDGGKADTPDKKTAARHCDLNFLRYAHVRAATPDEIDAGWHDYAKCWDSPNIKLSKTLGETTCSNNHPNYTNPNKPTLNIADGTGIVNIIYRAPAADMPIFSRAK
ncbi:hypothetical protein HZA42_01865 [Candidatus Peregrinibacteria bacterium]|nr:hypothetical protein [Candidatus Peregrinibacteria bacterium]